MLACYGNISQYHDDFLMAIFIGKMSSFLVYDSVNSFRGVISPGIKFGGNAGRYEIISSKTHHGNSHAGRHRENG